MESMDINYNLITSRRQYNFRHYKKNGYYISNLFKDKDAMNCLGSLFDEINGSKLLSSGLKENVFNEKQTPKGSRGRFMVPFDKLEAAAQDQPIYNNVVNLTKQISDDILAKINNDLGFNIDKTDSIPTILETLDHKTKPQIIHVDIGYDYEYGEQALVIIALEDDTTLRIINGSHNYPTLDDYYNNFSNKYQVPSVVNLVKGEFVVIHPKLFHSGWTAFSNNVRLHFYFGLNHLFQNEEHNTQNTTYFLNLDLYKVFDGSGRKEHCQSMSQAYHDKKNAAKKRKADCFKK